MSNRVPSTSSATNFTLRRFLTALFCRMPGGSRCLILIAAATLVATGLARTTVEGRHGDAVGQEPPVTAPDATIDRVRNPPLATRPGQPAGRLAHDRRARAAEPRRLREGSTGRDRARQGALLGHAGGERWHSGLRELSFPRRRRSAIEEPGEPGVEARSRT